MLMLLGGGCDWTFIHSSTTNSGFAVDAGFSPTQATNLVRRWRFHVPGSMFATPVTFHRIVYLPAGDGTLYALDTRKVSGGTPSVLWSRSYGTVTPTTCPTSPTGLVASAAVRDDGEGNPLVVVSTPLGTLQELDGLTGEVRWESKVYTIPDDAQNDYFSWSSPMIVGERVYVGVSSNCDTPFVRGELQAFDVTSGAHVATYSSMPASVDPDAQQRSPAPPTDLYVGAGVWTTSAAGDGASIYVTTGSTYDSTNAAHPPQDTNDFDQYSLVKLDGSDLTKQGKFAIPQPDGGDPDWGSGAILFRARLDGRDVQVAGGCNKDGNFYAVRTDTMTPIWAVHVGLGTPAGELACLSGGVWDGTHLYVTGNDTTVGATWTAETRTSTSGDQFPLWSPSGGTAAPSATRELDPATGLSLTGDQPRPVWETANPSAVLGSCSINGASTLLACQTTDWSVGFNALLLTDARSGERVAELHDSGEFPGFSTPVWSDGSLMVTDTDGIRAYSPAS
jgi:hypothetical protein